MSKATDQLLELAAQQEALEVATWKAVMDARADGASWQAIANALGGTRQRVQQKYGKGTPAVVIEAHRKEDADAVARRTWMTAPQLTTEPQLPSEPSKIVDTKAPAKEPATHQLVHLGGDFPTGVEQRTGKGPDSCPACGRGNHKAAGHFHSAEVTPECSPTKYDTRSITDYLTGKVPAYTPSYDTQENTK